MICLGGVAVARHVACRVLKMRKCCMTLLVNSERRCRCLCNSSHCLRGETDVLPASLGWTLLFLYPISQVSVLSAESLCCFLESFQSGTQSDRLRASISSRSSAKTDHLMSDITHYDEDPFRVNSTRWRNYRRLQSVIYWIHLRVNERGGSLPLGGNSFLVAAQIENDTDVDG